MFFTRFVQLRVSTAFNNPYASIARNIVVLVQPMQQMAASQYTADATPAESRRPDRNKHERPAYRLAVEHQSQAYARGSG